MFGLALIAPGGKHIVIKRVGSHYQVDIVDGPLVSRHKPSVDVLFDSAAELVGRNAIGVILTGMGKDGACGLLRLRLAGARTFGQDEASCVVYGMPREAALIGAVEEVAALEVLPRRVLSAIGRIGSTPARAIRPMRQAGRLPIER